MRTLFINKRKYCSITVWMIAGIALLILSIVSLIIFGHK